MTAPVFFHGGSPAIECPGCGRIHLYVAGRWSWNGSLETPTFNPSYLSKSPHGEKGRPFCCHSFVTDGNIRFLSDCTHELAGKTVKLSRD